MAQISKIQYSQLSEFFGRFDAEFYKPESLQADQIIRNQKNQKLGTLVRDGYRVVYENTKILKHENVNHEFDALFLQAANISTDGLWVEVNDIGFVKGNDWQRYPKGRINHGEVLIEVKGQAEKVTIVQDYIPIRTLVTGSVFKLSLFPNSISHEYLFAFFSSKYGKILRDRTKVNTLISYVSKPELYRIRIPIPDKTTDVRISTLVKVCFNKQFLSKSLYAQATKLLEEELGMNKIEFSKEKVHATTFGEIVTFNRSDADFYQIKYRQLKDHLNSLDSVRLSNICTLKKGFEVGSKAYIEEGPLFIRVSNLTKEGFSFGNSDKYISNSTYESLIKNKPKIGDVLLTKDGTIGTCYVVDEEIKGIISGGILNLQQTNSGIPPEYLALVLNSKICQMQAQRDCSGALILHWKPEDIRKLRIPLLKSEKMLELADLVIKSKEARNESKNLLEQAKSEVETLIEQAAETSSS